MHIFVFSILMLFNLTFSQDEKVLTKMDRFVSNTGQIMKLENFNLPDLKGYSEFLKVKIRRATTQGESQFYLLLIKEDEYGDKSAAIAEEDLDDLIKAMDELISLSENETTTSDYYENKFTTEDGFQIGYGGSKKPLWFVTLTSYGKSTILFDKFADLKATFLIAQKKISELKSS